MAMSHTLYVDMHCHCHEIPVDKLREYVDQGFTLVCVSDDIESSKKTLAIAKKLDIVPCLGIHPWEVHNHSLENFYEFLEKAISSGVKCLGEVGLDKAFYSKTYRLQEKVFRVWLEYAKEYELVLNIHAAGAWREVYDYLVKWDIDRAFIHWYTGPLDLLEEIVNTGYYVGINPAWKIQAKHRRIAEVLAPEAMLTESDAPYKYRGYELSPSLIPETVRFIAMHKQLDVETVKLVIVKNYYNLFK